MFTEMQSKTYHTLSIDTEAPVYLVSKYRWSLNTIDFKDLNYRKSKARKSITL